MTNLMHVHINEIGIPIILESLQVMQTGMRTTFNKKAGNLVKKAQNIAKRKENA